MTNATQGYILLTVHMILNQASLMYRLLEMQFGAPVELREALP
jgi:hypothetical protein